MINQSPRRSALQNMVQEAGPQLEELKSFPFSEKARGVLTEKIRSHKDHLILEATKLSKRRQADTVSAIDVQRANEYLGAGKSSRFFGRSKEIGGALLGASLTQTCGMIVSGRLSCTGIVLSVAFGILGAFLIPKE